MKSGTTRTRAAETNAKIGPAMITGPTAKTDTIAKTTTRKAEEKRGAEEKKHHFVTSMAKI